MCARQHCQLHTHTATRCNTLQRTATLCNTLHHLLECLYNEPSDYNPPGIVCTRRHCELYATASRDNAKLVDNFSHESDVTSLFYATAFRTMSPLTPPLIFVLKMQCMTLDTPYTIREVGGWGRDPKKCTGRDWGMGSSTI